jgi:hypothetical protein
MEEIESHKLEGSELTPCAHLVDPFADMDCQHQLDLELLAF